MDNYSSLFINPIMKTISLFSKFTPFGQYESIIYNFQTLLHQLNTRLTSLLLEEVFFK
jgi:hypothetical protein